MSWSRAAALGLIALGACARGRTPATRPSPAAPPARAPAEAGVKPDTTTALPKPAARLPAVSVPITPPPKRTGESTRRCLLDFPNTDTTRFWYSRDSASRSTRGVTYVGGGIRGNCRGQAITIDADSAESYDQSQLYILIGNVHYREPKVSVDAQRVTYYKAEERLLFERDVHAVQRDSSSVMNGPRAEYFRQVQGLRDSARFVATERPHLTYVEKDSLGKPQHPVTLDAIAITADGDSTYYASGDVVIIRTDLIAHGDSAVVLSAKRFARLMRKPLIESRGSQPFTLRGRTIDLFGAGRAIDRIVALDSATAVSKDLTVVSDTIDLRVTQNKLNRAFAFGATGATATTPARTVIADSLDILMPDQRLRELHAIGKAYVESDPDTTKVKSDERDWLRGDTVIAMFDTVATKDTTKQAQMRDVVASGQASAYYQVAPTSKPGAGNQRPAPSPGDCRSKPGINYVRGRVIHLTFDKGEVATVTVDDKASGIFAEPDCDGSGEARRRQARQKPATTGRPPTTVPPIRRPPFAQP